MELNTRKTGGNKTLKKFPPCCTKIFFFLWSGVRFSARAIKDFVWTISFLLAALLTGTVSLSTSRTHSQMVLTKASSTTFKIAFRCTRLHFARSFRKSWFFLSHWAMLNWTIMLWYSPFIPFWRQLTESPRGKCWSSTGSLWAFQASGHKAKIGKVYWSRLGMILACILYGQGTSAWPSDWLGNYLSETWITPSNDNLNSYPSTIFRDEKCFAKEI